MNEDRPCVATKWDQFCGRWLHRHAIEDLLYRLLSTNDCGNNGVPLNHETLRFTQNGCEQVACFLNDAFEIGLGYPYRWHYLYRREEFNRIVRWYLWCWAAKEWFGLRRLIWYMLLHRRVNRHRGRR